MTADGNTQTQSALINPDPRFSLEKEEYQAIVDFQVDVIIVSKKYSMSVTAANRIRTELRKLDKALQDKNDLLEGVTENVKEFKGKFQKLADKIMPKGIGYRGSMEMALRGGSLSSQIMSLGGSVSGYPSAPTETDLSMLKQLSETVDELVKKLNEVIKTKIPELNELLKEHKLKSLKAPKEVKL